LLAPVTGVQRFAFQLLVGLLEARTDLKVRVYVPTLDDSKRPLLAQLRASGAEVVVGPQWMRNKQVFEQVGLPLMALRDRVTTLVHLNNNISVARRGLQICFVYDIASMRLPRTYRLAYRLKFQATIAAIRWRVPAVVTLSQFSKRELESVGVAVSAVVLGGFGSPMLLEAESPDTEVLDAANPAGVEGPFALVFGSADPRKRVEEVIAAWPHKHASSGLKLVVVQGVAPTHRSASDEQASEQGIVRLRGRISDADLVSLTKQARFVVFGSEYEGGALAAQEVLALGTPVVAADIPTFRELLAPPVAFFHDFDGLGEACAQVLVAARPAVKTPEQVRQSWREAGAAFGAAIDQPSAAPAPTAQRGNSPG
jgi:glycosyltransferase involved in cell wall biosynthesis